MRRAIALQSYNDRVSCMAMRGLPKATNRTPRLIYGLGKPCRYRLIEGAQEQSGEIIQVQRIKLRRINAKQLLYTDISVFPDSFITAFWRVNVSRCSVLERNLSPWPCTRD